MKRCTKVALHFHQHENDRNKRDLKKKLEKGLSGEEGKTSG